MDIMHWSRGWSYASCAGNLDPVPGWLGNKCPTGHTAKKKVCLHRFAFYFPSLERITYFTKNVSRVILFQPSMCVAMGPGQDMFESTQIIGRIIYDKAKVSCGPCCFYRHSKLYFKIHWHFSLGSWSLWGRQQELKLRQGVWRYECCLLSIRKVVSHTAQEPLSDCLWLTSYRKYI